MFDSKDSQWFIHGSDKKVTIIHQDYFRKDIDNKFSSLGTAW